MDNDEQIRRIEKHIDRVRGELGELTPEQRTSLVQRLSEELTAKGIDLANDEKKILERFKKGEISLPALEQLLNEEGW